MDAKLRLAVFASHGGSDFQALADAAKDPGFPAEVALLVCNNAEAYVLERARRAQISAVIWQRKNFADDEAYVQYMLDRLREAQIDLICLAGYMKLVPSQILREYKVINIHPALLPKYGGKGMFGIHVHEAVLAAGEEKSGATVHQVDEVYDHGRILAQEQVPVKEGDTPETLQQRVLECEHRLYPQTVAKIARGEITLD